MRIDLSFLSSKNDKPVFNTDSSNYNWLQSTVQLAARPELIQLKKGIFWGAWVAQSGEHWTSAQVIVSRFVNWIPVSGSGLTAQSLEPASDSVSPSLSLSLPLLHLFSLKNKQTLKKFFSF